MVFAGTGCVSLIVWQVRGTLSTTSSKPPDSYDATTSYILAQQVVRELSNQQGMVLLIYPPARTMDSQTMDDLTYVFARVLRSAPGLHVRTTNLPDSGSAPTDRLSLADFEQVFPAAPGEVAYVSFAGVPSGIEGLSVFQRQPAPRLLLFDPLGSTDWLPGLKKGVIRCVIVPRPGARAADGGQIQGRPEEVFNRFFLMATPQTADQVAALLRR